MPCKKTCLRICRRFLSKTVVILLSIAVTGALPVLSGAASDVPTLTVSQGSALPGETVTISFQLSNNPGIAGLSFQVVYDATRLSINSDDSIVSGTALGRLSFVGPNEETYMNNPFTVLWYGASNDSSTGDLIRVTFNVLDSAPDGMATVDVNIRPNGSVNRDEIPVPLTIIPGGVLVMRDDSGDDPSDDPPDNEPPPTEPPDTEPPDTEPDPIPPIEPPENEPDPPDVTDPLGDDPDLPPPTDSPGFVPDPTPPPYTPPVSDLTPSPAPPPVSDPRVPNQPAQTSPLETVSEEPLPVSFVDVLESDWFFDAVSFAAARGLFIGVGDDRFAPDDTMTRAMFITVLARLDGVELDDNLSSPFTDTEIESWYGPSVAWARQNGIIDDGILAECDPDTFRPEDPITREQMAVIFANYIRFKDYDLPLSFEPEFSDADQAADWAQEAIQGMRDQGIILGMGGNRYEPKAQSTRAQVAQIFMNLVNVIGG